MSVALRRLSCFHLKLHDVQVPRSNETNLSQRSCQTIIETLSPGWSQTWSKASYFLSQKLSHTWASHVQDVHLSSKQIQQTYRTVVVKPSLKH